MHDRCKAIGYSNAHITATDYAIVECRNSSHAVLHSKSIGYALDKSEITGFDESVIIAMDDSRAHVQNSNVRLFLGVFPYSGFPLLPKSCIPVGRFLRHAPIVTHYSLQPQYPTYF